MFTGKNKGTTAKGRHASWLGWLLSNKYSLLAPPIVLALVVCAMRFGPTMQIITRLENLTLDLRMVIRKGIGDPAAHPDILVVGIEEECLRLYGRWPWTRDVHTKMMLTLFEWAEARQEELRGAGMSERAINEVPPRVIAFDLMFPEAESERVDRNFGDAAASWGNVITGAHRDYTERLDDSQEEGIDQITGDLTGLKALNSTNYGFTEPLERVNGNTEKLWKSKSAILPVPLIAESTYTGFVDSPPDPGGVRRRLPLVFNVGGKVYPSLVLQTLMIYWNLTPADVEVNIGENLTLNLPDGATRVIPLTERAELRVNWRNRYRIKDVRYSSLAVNMEAYVAGNPWPKDLIRPSGKILLVGQIAEGLTDLGATPFSPYDPLVFTHANAINSILNEDYLEPVPFHYVAIFWLISSWATLLILRRGNVDVGFVVPLLVSIGLAALATMLFVERNAVFDLFWPLSTFMALHSGAVFLRWKEESDAKRQIRAVFGTYISEKVMDQILQHPEDIKLGGDSKAVAILFSDIRGFTTISESLTEQELVSQLNEYFERMVHSLNKYEGTLHKYIGDAIMAAWGDVTDHPPEQLARDAVRSALDMIDELEALNQRWVSEGRLRWNIGLGINYGTVMVGNIGATQRREFTLIGDPVNAASRFEGVTKEFGVKLCVGESVHALLGKGFVTRPLGLLQVKGKNQALRVYEVLADRDNIREGVSLKDLGQWLPDYHKAFELYLKREFAEAGELFAKCLEARPGDICCTTYLADCQEYLVTPPGEDWQGIYVMKTK